MRLLFPVENGDLKSFVIIHYWNLITFKLPCSLCYGIGFDEAIHIMGFLLTYLCVLAVAAAFHITCFIDCKLITLPIYAHSVTLKGLISFPFYLRLLLTEL